MTKHEAIIASAYTGVLFPGVSFSDLHEAIEEKLYRPIFTHQFADQKLWDEIRTTFKDDFVNIEVTGDDNNEN